MNSEPMGPNSHPDEKVILETYTQEEREKLIVALAENGYAVWTEIHDEETYVCFLKRP